MAREPTIDFQEVIAREQAGETTSDILADLGYSPAQLEELRESSSKLLNTLNNMETWLESGDPVADWAVVMMPVRFSDMQRIEALRRILGRCGPNPIYRAKWNANYGAFSRAMEDLDITIEELSEGGGWEAVSKSVGKLTPREARQKPKRALSSFRWALEKLVCEDLLGPGWLKHEDEGASSEDLSEEGEQHNAMQARASVAILVDKAGLSPAEAELLAAYQECKYWPETAIALGISQDAMRQRKLRLLRRLRAAEGIQPE